MNVFKALVLPIYLPSFLLSVCRGVLIPLLPLFATDFGVSYSLVGLALAGESLGMLAGNLPAGHLLRRLGRRQVMVLGVGLATGSVLALVWAGSIWEVLVYRLAAGVGAALWNISRHAYLAEAVPGHQRGRAISLFGGSTRFGMFAGPALGGILAARWGFAGAFWVHTIIGIITLGVVAIFTERSSSPAGAALPQRPSMLTVLGDHYRMLGAAGLAQLGGQMIRAARQVILPLYGAEVIGLDVGTVGLIVSAASLIDMSLFYPAGLVMDRFGRKFAIVPCFLIQSIGMALIPFASSALTLLVFAAVIGFGNGLGAGSMMTLGADLAPKDALGEFLGMWRLIGDGGSTGAPLAVGAVADALDLSTAALVMAAVGLGAVLLFFFTVPETLERYRERPA